MLDDPLCERRQSMRASRHFRISIAALMVPVVAFVALASPASARSVGGYFGHPLDNAPRICFSESNGIVSYTGGSFPSMGITCPSTARWQVILPVDFAGSYSVTVQAVRTSSATACQALAVDTSGTVVSQSNKPFINSGSLQPYNLTAVSVPAAGYLFVYCDNMGTGSKLGSINW
jgi:hypothetical protein